MTTFWTVCAVLALASLGSIEGRYPSRHKQSRHQMYPRSIREEPKVPLADAKEIKEYGLEGTKELTKEGLLDRENGGGPRLSDLKLAGPFGPMGGPKGQNQYGPEGPKRGPYPMDGPEKEEGPEGPRRPFDGPPGGFVPMELGPDGPMGCVSRRCNPFKSRKGYKSYMKRMDRRYGRYGPPMGGMYGPPPPSKYPFYTEVIIIRKVPIILSKLLLIAAAKADKVKPGDKYPPKPLPVPPPAVEYDEKLKPQQPGSEQDDIILQDAPSFEYTKKQFAGEVPYSGKRTEAMKGAQGLEPKDKEFEDAMGVEEIIPAAKAYAFQGDKGIKRKDGAEEEGEGAPEKGSAAQPSGVVKKEMKFEDKEYLEKPNAFGDNDLQPRSEPEESKKVVVEKEISDAENQLKA